MNGIAQIDRSGRLVVPKALRDALHLRAGDRLRVRTEGETLVLEPEMVYAKTVIGADGWPMLESVGDREPLPASAFNDLIDEIREERMRHVMGLDD